MQPEIRFCQLHSFRVRQKTAYTHSLITVAFRRWLLAFAFTLRLRGPFDANVRAGFHHFPLSGAPVRHLLVLVIACRFLFSLIIGTRREMSRDFMANACEGEGC
ncbi:MAG: hypothetical protein ABFC97_09495 [Anaerolineaceae bacterium]